MGAIWSSARNQSLDHQTKPQIDFHKRQRLVTFDLDGGPRIISGLSDEITIQILARVPCRCYSRLKAVCKTWNFVLRDSEIFKLRKDMGLTEEWIYILLKDEEIKILWHMLDPSSGKWQGLPPMLDIVHEEESNQSSLGWTLWNALGNSSSRLMGIVKNWLGRKDSLDRTPFCGCVVGSLDECLYVLGGFSRACALRCVWYLTLE